MRSPTCRGSPCRSASSRSPSSATTPTISWPRIPGIGLGRRPLHECTSDPHTVAIATRTSAPPARGRPSGSWRTEKGCPGPWNSAARAVSGSARLTLLLRGQLLRGLVHVADDLILLIVGLHEAAAEERAALSERLRVAILHRDQ